MMFEDYVIKTVTSRAFWSIILNNLEKLNAKFSVKIRMSAPNEIGV